MTVTEPRKVFLCENFIFMFFSLAFCFTGKKKKACIRKYETRVGEFVCGLFHYVFCPFFIFYLFIFIFVFVFVFVFINMFILVKLNILTIITACFCIFFPHTVLNFFPHFYWLMHFTCLSRHKGCQQSCCFVSAVDAGTALYLLSVELLLCTSLSNTQAVSSYCFVFAVSKVIALYFFIHH